MKYAVLAVCLMSILIVASASSVEQTAPQTWWDVIMSVVTASISLIMAPILFVANVVQTYIIDPVTNLASGLALNLAVSTFCSVFVQGQFPADANLPEMTATAILARCTNAGNE